MNDTSLTTYENEIRPHLGEKQAQVRRLLLAYPEGMTNSEIGKLLAWTPNRVTPRVFELRKLGAVKDAGKRTCRVTGRTAHVWKLTYHDIPKVERKEERVPNQLQLI
jgi:hypothetical protein